MTSLAIEARKVAVGMCDFPSASTHAPGRPDVACAVPCDDVIYDVRYLYSLLVLVLVQS